jgi:hypothetical protein
MAKVAINSFVRRQTPESPYTHFEGTDEELIEMVETYIVIDAFAQKGYRDGVVLVQVPSRDFFTGIVQLKSGDIFVGKYESRRLGELPRQSIQVKREHSFKQLARLVQVVCYRHDVLVEDGDAETDAEWEIISLNGYPTHEFAPIDPMTLMHNHFGSDGGTATNMNAKDFEEQMHESFSYWKDKGLLA